MGTKVDKDEKVVAAMFNDIAGSYDLLNHLLSFGIDNYWRRVLIKRVKKERVSNALDIACGTGDLTISMAKLGIATTGVDIASNMLDIANKKSANKLAKYYSKKGSSITPPNYICTSAHQLPFPNNHFDIATIGFGIRNFQNRGESLLEIQRVLKPGGKLLIVEFATPHNKLWRSIFNLYFLKIVPFIGKVISGSDNAYNYLPSSVSTFLQYQEFAQELTGFGYSNVSYNSLTGGVAVFYFAQKQKEKT